MSALGRCRDRRGCDAPAVGTYKPGTAKERHLCARHLQGAKEGDKRRHAQKRGKQKTVAHVEHLAGTCGGPPGCRPCVEEGRARAPRPGEGRPSGDLALSTVSLSLAASHVEALEQFAGARGENRSAAARWLLEQLALEAEESSWLEVVEWLEGTET